MLNDRSCVRGGGRQGRAKGAYVFAFPTRNSKKSNIPKERSPDQRHMRETSPAHTAGTQQNNYRARTFSSSPSFMLTASRRAAADRDTAPTRAVVGVLLSHREPKPHGVDRPTGAPTKAALFDAWPTHGLAVAVPAATARRAQVFIIM